MNLPNALTLLRIFFVPFLVAVLVQDYHVIHAYGLEFTNITAALVIFLCAAFTDLLDGYLARRWGLVTTVGTLLDPIADKLLISSALIALVEVHAVPAWMVVLVVGREFAVSGLRAIAASAGYTIRASELGKTKMITQVIAILLLLLAIENPGLKTTAKVWLWGVVIAAVASACHYFLKFWGRVDAEIKRRRRAELLLKERRQRASRKEST